MAALNPGQFKGPLYHGTTHDLQGSDIKPAAMLSEDKANWGEAGHSGQKSSNHAFATENENTAWQFGSQAGMMQRAKAQYSTDQRLDPGVSEMLGQPHHHAEVRDVGRVRVHEVAPHPLMRKGVYHGDHPAHDGGEDLQEWVAPAFHVKNTLDTMPGRQGTFPSLNWNQFKSPGAGYGPDANHPSDAEATYGIGRDRVGTRNAAMVANGPSRPPADEHQMDLFSGKTVGEHAEKDGSPVGDYHRNNMFGSF